MARPTPQQAEIADQYRTLPIGYQALEGFPSEGADPVRRRLSHPPKSPEAPLKGHLRQGAGENLTSPVESPDQSAGLIRQSLSRRGRDRDG